MSDTALIKRFTDDPEGAYGELLDRYTPVLLRMIRRFLTDPDEVMETYTAICERMRANEYLALRRFRLGSELTPWLSVVVANACRDRFRKHRVVSAPQSVISQLDERQRHVFRYYYQEQMPHEEIAEVLGSKHGTACSVSDVVEAIQAIDDLLSINKRWHLLAALRANRPMVSFEDLAEAGIEPIDRATIVDGQGDGALDEDTQALNEALRSLDAEDQLLVLLRFEHGMRASQIAHVLKFDNQKYVYTRLRTVVNRLRRYLERDTQTSS